MIRSSCPHCNHPVDPQDSHCTSCGLDLALAATLVENTLSVVSRVPDDAILAPEVLVPRLGERLAEKGLLSQEQLQQALQFQRQRSRKNQPILLGQALLHLGFVDQQTLDRTITEQILQLQEALQNSNRDLEARVRTRTQDLQAALEKLTEVNQLKANFLSNISHELRTPLTHIRGYLELLLMEELGPSTDAQSKGLEVMEKATQRLQSLINDLIRFAATSRGEIQLKLLPTPVDEVCLKAAERARRKAAEKNVQLVLEIPEPGSQVLVDAENMVWVLSQLLDNAIKFTPAQGRATLQVDYQEGAAVIFSVSDTGIGIAPERMEEIFVPFHQLDGSTTRRYGGTGLGLTLVNQILEAHSISLQIESSPGQGTRFYFSIPVHQASSSPVGSASS